MCGAKSLPLLQDLLITLDARFLLVSFSNEGFIKPAAMRAMLEQIGRVDALEIQV